MDARQFNGDDDREDRGDRQERVSGGRLYFYGCACDGLVRSVELAACSEWQPYIGDTTVYALASLRHVFKQGRALGLIPTREEMEQAA